MIDIGSNYLAVEPHLISTLEKVAGFKEVCSTNDLAEVEERSQKAPCAHVIYFGDRVPDVSNAGVQTQVNQLWLVVIAVRQGRDTSKEAGELIKQTLSTLQQHSFVPGVGALNRVNSPARPRYTKGFAYYPLAFSVNFKVRG